MTPDQVEAVRRRVAADRRAQGLADHVTEVGVLRRVALVIGAAMKNGTPATTPESRTNQPSDHPSSKEAINAETT